MSSEAEQSRAGSLEDSAVASADEGTPKPCYLGLWVPVVLVVVAVSVEASRDSRVEEAGVASEVASAAVEVVAASVAAAAVVVISLNVVVIGMADTGRPAALHLVPALIDETATEVIEDPPVGMNLGEAVAHMMIDTAAAEVVVVVVVAIATVADMAIEMDDAQAATWNPSEAEKVDAEKVGTERETTTDLLAMTMAAENVATTAMVMRILENYDDTKLHANCCSGGFIDVSIVYPNEPQRHGCSIASLYSNHWIKYSQWDSYSA